MNLGFLTRLDANVSLKRLLSDAALDYTSRRNKVRI